MFEKELKTIGKMLQELRKENGYTQAVVADKLGISVSQYRRYEKGTTAIRINAIEKLSYLYDVPVDYILGRTLCKERYNTDNKKMDIEAPCKIPEDNTDSFLEVLHKLIFFLKNNNVILSNAFSLSEEENAFLEETFLMIEMQIGMQQCISSVLNNDIKNHLEKILLTLDKKI